MALDDLRAELERLYDLEQLKELSRELLGLDPNRVGGTAAKGSFAKALLEHCAAEDAMEALADAVWAQRGEDARRFAELRVRGFALDEELESGESLGPYLVLKKIGEGPVGISYLARRDGIDVRLQVLRRRATLDKRGLQRFLTGTRLLATLSHPGIPSGIQASLVEDRWTISHDHVDGQSLAERLKETGPLSFVELRGLLLSILEPLALMHARRVAHGALCLENLLVVSTDVVLLDAASHHLRASLGDQTPADPRSDVYAFGALVYELFTGKQPSAEAPAPPSKLAPPGNVSRELDELVLRMLDKDPSKRPRNASVVRDALEAVDLEAFAPLDTMADDELDALLQALIAEPDDEQAASELEAAVTRGADPRRVVEAFRFVADLAGRDRAARHVQRRLLARAAKVHDAAALDRATAEELYAELCTLDPSDPAAEQGLLRARRQLGKWTEVVEMLLARSEHATSRKERARILAELGQLYAVELDDRAQALIAYAEAYCQDPESSAYAAEVERLAGSSHDAWSEALDLCVQSAAGEMPAHDKNLLWLRMARWYADKVQRPDLALPCYSAVLSTDPRNDAAFEGLTAIYRAAQRWMELGAALIARADVTESPALARDLRAEAAGILEQLREVAGARDLYERILAEDPGHATAGEALTKIHEAAGDPAGALRVLERRADACRGEERYALLCRAAELYEGPLADLSEASRRFAAVLDEDPAQLGALRGLDRVYRATGEYDELLRVLERQLGLAVTPRQKTLLWERIARVHATEFLDHKLASEAWEKVLELDPEHEEAFAALPRHYRALERWSDLAEIYRRARRAITDSRQRVEIGLELASVLAGPLESIEHAISAYEEVLEIEPQHPVALARLAELRAATGDASRALEAFDSLAAAAATPAARAEHYRRAARLLEERGELDLAIERYKLALDAAPDDRAVSASLRAAYVARGDAKAAVDLIEHELATTEGARARAKLRGEMARLCWELIGDEHRAEQMARLAITDDPTNLEALGVLGDLAFNASHYLEAAKHYEQVTNRLDALSPSEAARVIARHAEALVRSGSPEKAVEKAEWLLTVASDPASKRSAADLIFEHGDPARAHELYADLARHRHELTDRDQAAILHGLGESARKLGRLDVASEALAESIQRDPSSPAPYRALAKVHEAQGRWDEMARVLYDLLGATPREEQAPILMEIGELAAAKLHDANYAARMYLAALYESPNDRKVLMKLMQLYGETEDWDHLLEVIHRLAELVDDDKQKAKYLKTAGEIAAKQLGDIARAAGLLDRAVALDPSSEAAIEEALRQHRALGNAQSVKQLLKLRIKLAHDGSRTPMMLQSMAELANLYLEHFGDVAQAVAVYEAMQEIDAGNRQRTEELARLYASRPNEYFDKAITTYQQVLSADPYRADPYRALRRLYTKARFPDPAWCLCQTLSILGLADRDERRFFERLRAEGAAPARARLGDADWASLITHRDADPLLTAILTLIEPAVITARSKSWDELGYTSEHVVDPREHPYGLIHTLAWAAEVLGMELPPLFQNPSDPGGLSFLHATTPSLVLGRAALRSDVPAQTAAFIAGQQLTQLRPGYYVRHLLPTGTALKAWLLAAVKLISPHFPVTPELERPIQEALRALEAAVTGTYRDHLASLVSRLLKQDSALDLRKWIAATDLTADRAGLILCHDLETAIELTRAAREGTSSVATDDRIQALVLFSISTEYFHVRDRLGVGVETLL